MAIERREVMYADQLDDVMLLVVEMIRVIKEKGDYSSLVDDLVKAISGIEEIPQEFKANKEAFVNTVLLRASEIAFMFVKEEE